MGKVLGWNDIKTSNIGIGTRDLFETEGRLFKIVAKGHLYGEKCNSELKVNLWSFSTLQFSAYGENIELISSSQL